MLIRLFGSFVLGVAVLGSAAIAQEGGVNRVPLPPNPLPYDLLLMNGHVLDDKNHIDAVEDVGMKDGKIAASQRTSISKTR